MSGIQKFCKLIFPKRLFEAMEAESRQWHITCECGYSRSIWDVGGMRYKSKDNNKTYGKCPGCNRRKWLFLVKKEPA